MTEEVHSIDAHEYVRRENHQDVSVVNPVPVVLSLSGRFTRTDAEAACRFYRKSPQSAVSFRHLLLLPLRRPAETMFMEAI